MPQDQGALDHFRREAEAASVLNHPNICTNYDIGGEGGRHFIATEFLNRVTLKPRIADKPLAIDRVPVLRYRSPTLSTRRTLGESTIGTPNQPILWSRSEVKPRFWPLGWTSCRRNICAPWKSRALPICLSSDPPWIT
jgi:serine/threonine protein kinase